MMKYIVSACENPQDRTWKRRTTIKRYVSIILILGLGTISAQAQEKPAVVDIDNAAPPALINLERDEAVGHFCRNIETQAEAARFEIQMQRIEAKKQEINERIELLEQKRSEYESWLKKRNDFLEKTQESLITIVAKMKPGAAAEQLAVSDDMVAASILLKLKPAQASAIMNELPPEKAAIVTHILASAQKLPREKTLSTQTK